MPINTLYEVKWTNQFKKDYSRAKKQGKNIGLLQDIVFKLADGKPLLDSNRDHVLNGNWVGFRECHITPDWLLVYKKEVDILVLTLMRTGTHSQLDF